MKYKKILVLLAAVSLVGSALSEPVDTEYLVDMTSEQVVRLEQRLAELGFFSGSSDSTYDAETRAALESFQQANGLEVTGLADNATLERLESSEAVSRQDYLTRFANAYAQMTALEVGASSNDVLVMQRHLKDYGYFSGEPSGTFDEITRQAVESFQMVNGLPITGVADGATLMRLMADAPITWPAFLTEMSASEGDTGLNVYVLQSRLAQMGCFTGSRTACFGDLTREAVQRFQQEMGLEVTGKDGLSLIGEYSQTLLAKVLKGEWWRSLTAQTLHGDARHLASNLLCGYIVMNMITFRIPLLRLVPFIAVAAAVACGSSRPPQAWRPPVFWTRTACPD